MASKAVFFGLFKIISSILQRGSEDPPVRHGSGSYGAADALEFYDRVCVYTYSPALSKPFIPVSGDGGSRNPVQDKRPV